MSDVIRSFRITNSVYRRGDKTMDGRQTPFRIPTFMTPKSEPVPDVIIEGVPPIPQPKTKRHDT